MLIFRWENPDLIRSHLVSLDKFLRIIYSAPARYIVGGINTGSEWVWNAQLLVRSGLSHLIECMIFVTLNIFKLTGDSIIYQNLTNGDHDT